MKFVCVSNSRQEVVKYDFVVSFFKFTGEL